MTDGFQWDWPKASWLDTPTGTFQGFWWDGVWHEVRPSHGDDDGPPTGVREPRRPRPSGPPPMTAAVDADV